MPSLTKQVVDLYREGKNFSEIGEALKLDRHKVPHILADAKEPLRTPFQGSKAEWSKLYEKTPKGFLMRTYRNMQSRVTGVQKKKAHLYKGLAILPRDDFYAWAWDNSEFWRLYKQWSATDYDRRLSPSINRIDTNKGYTIGNIEWLTHSVNSSLGGMSLKRKSNKVSNLMEVYQHVQA
jgi:hypothetical protein